MAGDLVGEEGVAGVFDEADRFVGGMSSNGGRGAGCVRIFARQVEVVAGGTISANGGDGVDAGVGTGGSGGGGGGGGGILIVTENYINFGTVEAAGGAGGAKDGIGFVGGDGADGIVQIVRAA